MYSHLIDRFLFVYVRLLYLLVDNSYRHEDGMTFISFQKTKQKSNSASDLEALNLTRHLKRSKDQSSVSVPQREIRQQLHTLRYQK